MQVPLSELRRFKLYLARPLFTANSSSVIYLSNSACAIATSEAQSVKHRKKWPNKFCCRLDRGSNGSASLAICKMQLDDCKSLVPISLVLIALLLWINFGSVSDMLLAMSVIPMASIGGVFGLLIMGIPFSISAAIGFIALFGVSVMDGIIILSQYNQLIEAGLDRTSAVLRAGELQMRPVLMTCIIAGVGLLPAAISIGHRIASAKAAGNCRSWRHDVGAGGHFDHFASADHTIFTP